MRFNWRLVARVAGVLALACAASACGAGVPGTARVSVVYSAATDSPAVASPPGQADGQPGQPDGPGQADGQAYGQGQASTYAPPLPGGQGPDSTGTTGTVAAPGSQAGPPGAAPGPAAGQPPGPPPAARPAAKPTRASHGPA